MRWGWLLLAALLLPSTARSNSPPPSANQIIKSVLESDPWGMNNGAAIRASVLLTDKRGSTRELAFSAISKRHSGYLSMSVVRFSEPPELAGAGFLQIQHQGGDDDRFLFLPALRRARRISGNLRASAFMGTDFSFADLDRRDLREGNVKNLGVEKVGAHSCYVVDVTPRREDSQYSHLEMWIRVDNFLQLRTKMYDRSNVHVKTFEAQEIRRVSGSWFVSKSLMTDHKSGHSTLLMLREIVVDASIPDEEFSVRALERP